VAPGQPIARLESMDGILSAARGPQQFNTTLLGVFAWIALVLAAAGLWGLIAHGVARRTHEIGVRVALGAGPGEVLRMIAGRGLLLASVGIALGVLAALLLGELLQQVLFEVSAADPLTFVLIAGVFLAITVAASLVPAQRALRIDPVRALRAE
jgi:putative ABC transport system permease protein